MSGIQLLAVQAICANNGWAMESDYQELMKHLFRHMEIDLPLEQENDVYVVAVDDKVTMKFFAAPAAYLNVIAVIGSVPANSSLVFLLNLLNLNAFTPVYPHFNFKVGIAPQTNDVELWLRESMAGLQDSKIIELFDCMVEMAAYVKASMEKPVAQRKSISHSADILLKRHATPL